MFSNLNKKRCLFQSTFNKNKTCVNQNKKGFLMLSTLHENRIFSNQDKKEFPEIMRNFFIWKGFACSVGW